MGRFIPMDVGTAVSGAAILVMIIGLRLPQPFSEKISFRLLFGAAHVVGGLALAIHTFGAVLTGRLAVLEVILGVVLGLFLSRWYNGFLEIRYRRRLARRS